MIEFVLPAALLAAAGSAVPILLHLWRPPARTVRLGSLRFLETLPGRRLRDLRWRERLLLLLRVALLFALAALLAGPSWMAQRDGPQRWALLAPHAMLDGTARQEWDKLLAEGYQPRLLAPGFPNSDAPPPAPVGASDLWSLLREADARVPANSSFVVFAPPLAAHLRGERPALAHGQVRWIATPANTTNKPAAWIVPQSVLPSGRGLRATVGNSDASATRFSIVKAIELADAGAISDAATRTELIIRMNAGDVAVRLAGSKPEPWTPVAIFRPIRVAIVHGPQRAEDARYVAAAVQAVGDFSDRQVTVEVREETASTVLPESDWVFRLGASALTPSMSSVLAENRVNVVTDAPRDTTDDLRATWFVAPGGLVGVDEIRLWRRADAGAEAGAVIWSDGFGQPLLSFARMGRAERWRFFSRFHPESSDWVGSGAFPAWMRQVLLGDPDEGSTRRHDRRLVEINQIEPDRATSVASAPVLPPAAGRSLDLRLWLWAIVALLLALERGISLRASATPRGSNSFTAEKIAPKEMAGVVR